MRRLNARHRLTRDQLCNAATLYKFGWKLSAIAAHYGCHYATIRRGLEEMGLYHGPANRVREAMTEWREAA